MSEVQSVIKSIQKIMRKDAGVDGDAQRIGQLVWMMFLKIFDDQEQNYELIDPKYRSPMPEHLRWRNWASNPEGITGVEMLNFIEDDLFKTLKNLEVVEGNVQAGLVRSIFADTYNYMKNGTLIRQVVNKLNEINFNKKDDRHAFGDIYEHMLKELQSAGNAGEFYTPRPLTKFVVEMVAPKLGEKVLDPACGTGGFLVEALEYINTHHVKTAKDKVEAHANVHGVELKQLPHMLAMVNFMLHGVEDPTVVTRGDMLGQPLTNYGPKDRVDAIIANPPFGGVVADGTEGNFPARFKTKSTAELFLVLFIHLLKDGGRAGIVLPDGSLFGEGVITEIKKHLLETCNLHTIIRLPQGVFNPYAGVNTNLLFFTKGEPTKEIWYYHMPLPEGMKQYTKGRPIKDSEFDAVKEWWNDRAENDFAHKVSFEQVVDRNYNLDFKNSKGEIFSAEITSSALKEKILSSEITIQSILKEL
jgi:type I restriction enzyme M protein